MERFSDQLKGSADSDAVQKVVAQLGQRFGDRLTSAQAVTYVTGTALTGHVAALHSGICINLQEMDEVLALHTEDLDVVVQPGVTRKQLNHYLNEDK